MATETKYDRTLIVLSLQFSSSQPQLELTQEVPPREVPPPPHTHTKNETVANI